MRSSRARLAWRNPCEEARPSSVVARSSSLPSTLTCTRAWRRSGLVSTAVTVTNPMRGSLKPSDIRLERTSLTASFTLRMRSVDTLAPHRQVFAGEQAALHARPVREARLGVAAEAPAALAERAGLAAHECGGQRGALPELVVVGLGDGRSEAPLEPVLQGL